MKNTLLIPLAILLLSCVDKTEKEATQSRQENIVGKPDSSGFNINKIPISNKSLGEFPYLNPPENYCYGSCSSWSGKIKTENVKSYDKEYFAVNGKLYPVEGKSYKINIEKNTSKEPSPYNTLVVEKSYEKAIIELGGVKVNSVPVRKTELEKIDKKELYEKHYGYSLDPNLLDEIKTFVIHTKDKEIWIQYSGYDNSSGNLTILEKGILQTEEVTQITSDQILREIDKTGKAVLNINFDTDKATLKPDGKEVADEILKLLKENPALKLSIEGHTDNSGTKEHNKKLSLDRATTIKNYLTINGIEPSRLKTQGFGQDQPLIPNDTEEHKAQNRRVVLVRIK